MQEIYKIRYPSPIGILQIFFTKSGILRINFTNKQENINELTGYNKSYQINSNVKTQLKQFPVTTLEKQKCQNCRFIYQELNDYFTGKKRKFNLPLLLQGTDFQVKVWQQLIKIPYGQTRSYGQIASLIGKPGAAQAVGQANRQNPLPIFIPCHRVIGANGSLTGYAGSLWRKKWLLEHEQKYRKDE